MQRSSKGQREALLAFGLLGSLLAVPELQAQKVRKDWETLTAAEVASIRKGVAAMMALDVGKADKDLSPIGWKYQAFIHGKKGTEFLEGQNTCQHSAFHFLPWHRMELYFFERILRASAGDDNLTLPYWNSDAPPTGMDPKLHGARLPAAFRVEPTVATPNPLWWQHRNADINKAPGAAADEAKPLARSMVSAKEAFEQPNFFTNTLPEGAKSFGGGSTGARRHPPGRAGEGQLERSPHNLIHVAVGNGHELSLTDAAGAGLDPIFWPFHANMDRAWACWQQRKPDSEPKAEIWLKRHKFVFFDVKKNEKGELEPVKVEMTAEEVIDTAKQLDYKYDNNCKDFELPPLPPAPAPKSKVISETRKTREEPEAPARAPLTATVEAETVLAAEHVAVSIDIPAEMQERIEGILQGKSEGSVWLAVGGLAADRTVGAAYGLYIDLKEGAWPRDESDNYLSQLSFFGIGPHGGHNHGGEAAPDDENFLLYDLTKVAKGLAANNEWVKERLTVTFANTSAYEPDRVKAPPAPLSARARFHYVRLIVE